jgi:hypothetical protein
MFYTSRQNREFNEQHDRRHDEFDNDYDSEYERVMRKGPSPGVKRPPEGFELPDTKKLIYSEDYASISTYPFITFDLVSSFCSDSMFPLWNSSFLEILEEGIQMEVKGRVTLLQLDDTKFKGTIWEESKTKFYTTHFSIEEGSLKEIRCDCAHQDMLKWCAHRVASMLSLIRSPENVIEYDSMKSKLLDMKKEDLVTMMLNKAFLDDSFLVLIKNVEKDRVTEIALEEDDQTIGEEPVMDYKMYINDLLLIYAELDQRRYYGINDGLFDKAINIVRNLLETIHSMWQKKFFASSLGLLAAITDVVTVERNWANSVTSHNELCKDISRLWLKYITDDTIPQSLKSTYKEKFLIWSDRSAQSHTFAKYKSCAILSVSEWNEPWLVELMEGSKPFTCLKIPEDMSTLLERAIILKSKMQDFSPIINHVLKAGENPDLWKVMENISMPHAIVMMSCAAHFTRADHLWVAVLNNVLKLTSKYQMERSTSHVRGLTHLAMEEHVQTVVWTRQSVVDAFCLIPEQLQSLFCYHLCVTLLFYSEISLGGGMRECLKVISDQQDNFGLTRALSEVSLEFTTYSFVNIHSLLGYAFGQGPDVIRKLFKYFTTIGDEVMTLYALLCETKGYVTESFDFICRFGKCLSEKSEASKRLFNLIDRLDKNQTMPKLLEAPFTDTYTLYLVKSKLMLYPEFHNTVCLPKLMDLMTIWNKQHHSQQNSQDFYDEIPGGKHILYAETIPQLIWDFKMISGDDNEENLVKVTSHFQISDTLAGFATIAMGSNWNTTATMLVLRAAKCVGKLNKLDLFTKFSSLLNKDQKIAVLTEITKQYPTPENYRKLIELDPSWKDRMDELITVGSNITADAIPLLMEFKKYDLIVAKFLEFPSPYLPKLVTVLNEALKLNMKDEVIMAHFEGIIIDCIVRDFDETVPGGRRGYLLYEDTSNVLQNAGYPPGIPRELKSNGSKFEILIHDLFTKKVTKTATKLLGMYTSELQTFISSNRTRSYGEFVRWVASVKECMETNKCSAAFKEWTTRDTIYGKNVRNKPKLVRMLDDVVKK